MTLLFTIGYEAATVDDVVATLKSAGVSRLADVRAVPVSRKKGFSKKVFAAHLAEAGIEYLHFLQLGNPKPGRDAAHAKQWDLFTTLYTAHLDTDVAQQSLEQLAVAAAEEPTCLLCFERDPTTCHRSLIAKRLAGSGDFETVNLFGSESRTNDLQSHKMQRDRIGKGASASKHETR